MSAERGEQAASPSLTSAPSRRERRITKSESTASTSSQDDKSRQKGNETRRDRIDAAPETASPASAPAAAAPVPKPSRSKSRKSDAKVMDSLLKTPEKKSGAVKAWDRDVDDGASVMSPRAELKRSPSHRREHSRSSSSRSTVTSASPPVPAISVSREKPKETKPRTTSTPRDLKSAPSSAGTPRKEEKKESGPPRPMMLQAAGSAPMPITPLKSPTGGSPQHKRSPLLRIQQQEAKGRKRAQSFTSPSLAVADDSFPRIDRATLRRTKSESERFMHSWDYQPIFMKADRKKLKEKAIKAAQQKEKRRSRSLKSARSRDSSREKSSEVKKERENDTDISSLKYDDDGELEFAKLSHLLNFIFSSAASEEIILTFIFAHDQVMTTLEFLKELVNRFTAASRLDGSSAASSRANVLRVFELWLTHRYLDFWEPNAENLAGLLPHQEFIKQLREFPDEHKRFLDLLARQERAVAAHRNVNYDVAPDPILSKEVSTTKEFGLMDLHPLEVARQLTLLDFPLFQDLELSELINCAWMREKEAPTIAPHVVRLIERFNTISFWIATEIVSSPNKKQRVALLRHIIKLSRHLKELCNFHALMAVYCALNMHQIQRLAQTWADVPKSDIKFLKSLDEFLSSRGNYVNIRTAISDVLRQNPALPVEKQQACLPFHGVFLRAFVGINENDTFAEDGALNVHKLGLIQVQSREMLRLQSYTYQLIPVNKMLIFLGEVIKYNAGEEMLTRLSKQCEQSQDADGKGEKDLKRSHEKKAEEKKPEGAVATLVRRTSINTLKKSPSKSRVNQ